MTLTSFWRRLWKQMRTPRSRQDRRRQAGRARLCLESLEDRMLLSGGGFTPSQIQHAYGFDQIHFGAIPGDGRGQTIAIIDAYYDPTIVTDLQNFDTTAPPGQSAGFGLPAANLSVVRQDGTVVTSMNNPGPDPTGTWAAETALDVEWAHAIAPAANILLVETNGSDIPDQLKGVDYAAMQPGVSVVSMSFGLGEFSKETMDDAHFQTPANHAGITFVASSGDSGTIEYPAASPNVLGVGGTTLQLDNQGTHCSETVWNSVYDNVRYSSGGGVSAYESEPAYQYSVQQTGMRESPDVAYDADPNTGFWVYDTSGAK